MAEESRKIKLELGNVSWDSVLGTYYIDMRPAEIHYTNNIWNGSFDKNGVPMCGNGRGGYSYFPVNIAQYGFILLAKYSQERDNSLIQTLDYCSAKLIELSKQVNNYCVWLHNSFEKKYSIKPPWASAMAQGEIISFFLRMYQLKNDVLFLKMSNEAYEYLKIDFSDGGVRRIDENGYLWFEEYPSEPPSYVLNGFIYTIFGLIDLYRVTGRTDVKQDIDKSILTLKANLHRFDSGYWSNYDLLKRELVRYYYQMNVHVPQLIILHKLTGEDVFFRYGNKWQKTLTPLNFFFVQLMYRIRPRWKIIRSLLNSNV